ncbi:hypothetical protein N9L12_08190 [Luminiphilus sp.]|nr:hypothetical protein [Luminiphilus sp.]
MRKTLYTIILLLIAIPTHADPKKLTCTNTRVAGGGPHVGKEITTKIEAIVETNDFTKENPYAEITYAGFAVDGDYIDYTDVHTALGKTFRRSYVVTPTVITMDFYLALPDMGHQKIDIYRADLSSDTYMPGVGGKKIGVAPGQCQIEDVRTAI